MLGDGCVVCSAEKHPQADTCPRCKHILGRVETRRNSSGALRHIDRQARLRALQESWHDSAFHCFYTDITLVDDGERSHDHRYLVFDHRTPGDEASIVVTCALVNRMKTDLTEEQFGAVVTELAKVFAGGTFDERAFPGGAAPK
jgi:hypothetical protein